MFDIFTNLCFFGAFTTYIFIIDPIVGNWIYYKIRDRKAKNNNNKKGL